MANLLSFRGSILMSKLKGLISVFKLSLDLVEKILAIVFRRRVRILRLVVILFIFSFLGDFFFVIFEGRFLSFISCFRITVKRLDFRSKFVIIYWDSLYVKSGILEVGGFLAFDFFESFWV